MNQIIEMNLDDEFHERFWSNFRDYLDRNNSSLKPVENLFDSYSPRGSLNSYSGFYFGDIRKRSTLWLIAWIWPDRSRIAAKLRVDESLEPVFGMLEEDKDSIQEYFGEVVLDWDSPPDFSVGVYQDDVDFTDPFIYHKLYEWLQVNLEKIERVFNDRLATYFIEGSS